MCSSRCNLLKFSRISPFFALQTVHVKIGALQTGRTSYEQLMHKLSFYSDIVIRARLPLAAPNVQTIERNLNRRAHYQHD